MKVKETINNIKNILKNTNYKLRYNNLLKKYNALEGEYKALKNELSQNYVNQEIEDLKKLAKKYKQQRDVVRKDYAELQKKVGA